LDQPRSFERGRVGGSKYCSPPAGVLVGHAHDPSVIPRACPGFGCGTPFAHSPPDGPRAAQVSCQPGTSGGALYRSTEAPTVAVLFLGLACGVTPSTLGFSAARLGRARIAGTLSLLLVLRRLVCDVPASERPVHVPEFLRHGATNGALSLTS